MMQMIRILKTGVNPFTGEPQFTENFPVKTLVEVGQDQDGNPIYEEKWNIPQDENELRKAIEETIRYLEKERLNKILNDYGYDEGLVGVQTYAQQNDPEAQALWNFYLAYDDAIWNYIGSLQNKTMTELLQEAQDLIATEEQIYQSVIQNNPLS